MHGPEKEDTGVNAALTDTLLTGTVGRTGKMMGSYFFTTVKNLFLHSL
jgi:hypothetical protein